MAMTKERLAEWLSDIRKGDLYCPFEQCTWTFFTAFELADHLLDDCEFGRYKGNVPCTHCNEALKAEELKHHWRTYHKDEVSVLSHLDRGTQSCCPNYLCARIFQGTFDGCKEYLKHSITCHPLYICVKCKGEFKTKLILTQHSPICKGEVKREVLKSVSKNETRVDRDVKQRPQLTDEEEDRHIEEWKKAIKVGNLSCPVPSCTKRFFFPNHFVQHLSIESKIDSIFNKIDIIECPFCNSYSHWLIFGRHLNDYHRDIMTILNKLKNGSDIICPNYKCIQGKVYSSNEGFEYLQHAINCRPLYMCKLCGTETKHQSYLKKHFVSCQGVGNGKKRLKHENSEEENGASSDPSEAFQLKENSAGKGKKKMRNSTEMLRKNMPLRKRSPLHKKGTIVKSEESSSGIKTKGAKNRKLSQKRKLSLLSFQKDSCMSSDNTDFEMSNDDHNISFTCNVLPGHSSAPLSSPDGVHHHKTFLQNAIKNKVLKSISTSSFGSSKDSVGEPLNQSKPHRTLNDPEWLDEWKSKFSKGIFRCGNEDCPESFILPKKLIDHMQNCLCDDSNNFNLLSETLTCLWCDDHMQIIEFKDHASLNHSMLLETLQGECSVCQNYDCNTICDSAQDLLRHSAECPTCIVCVDCKLTFTSEDDYKKHDCMANDDLFRKRSIDMWRNQIRSGQLQCANLSCSSKFYLFDEFVNHLRVCAKKSKFCKFAIEEGKMPCSHCSVMLSCDEIIKHFTEDHFEIINELNKLNNGETIKCISFKCKKIFDDPFKFFHHSTVCKPLYLCSTCTESFNGYRLYISHPCMDTEEEDTDVVSEEWYMYLKEAIYICPNKKCEKSFKTFEGLLPHLRSCKKGNRCEYVLQKDVFGCCICQEDVALSAFTDHFTQKHNRIMNQLLKMEISYSLRCENKSCKKVFVDRGKLLKHYMECKRAPCERKPKEKPTFSLSKWHEEIKKGNLYCPNCNAGFVELSLFIQHLRSCTSNTLASKAILTPLPCFICKNDFPALSINDHFKNTHTLAFAQLRLVEQGICIHCPNNGCKKPFTKGIEYLHHVATVCEHNLPCELCGEYFSSKELLDSHDCPQKEKSETDEKLWSDAIQNVWYDKVMKGDLRCPNFRCALDFILPRNFIDHIRVCTEGDACAAVINRKELPCCFCKRYVLLGRYCSHLASCHNKTMKARSTPLTKQEKKIPIPSSSSMRKKRKSEMLPPEVSIPNPDLISVGDNEQLSPVDLKLKSEILPSKGKPCGLLKKKLKAVKGSKDRFRQKKDFDASDNSAANPITIDTPDPYSIDNSGMVNEFELTLNSTPFTELQNDVYEIDENDPVTTSEIVPEETDKLRLKQCKFKKSLGPKTRSKRKDGADLDSTENVATSKCTDTSSKNNKVTIKESPNINVPVTRKSKFSEALKLKNAKLYEKSTSLSDSEENILFNELDQSKKYALVEDSVDSEYIPKPHSTVKLHKFKHKKMSEKFTGLSTDLGNVSMVKKQPKSEPRKRRSKVMSAKYVETTTDSLETDDLVSAQLSKKLPLARKPKSDARKRKSKVTSEKSKDSNSLESVDTAISSCVDSIREPCEHESTDNVMLAPGDLCMDPVSQTGKDRVIDETIESAADSDNVSLLKRKENLAEICKGKKKYARRKSRSISHSTDCIDTDDSVGTSLKMVIETDNDTHEHVCTDSSDMLAHFSGPVVKESEKTMSDVDIKPVLSDSVESNVEENAPPVEAAFQPTDDVDFSNEPVHNEKNKSIFSKDVSLNGSSSKCVEIMKEKPKISMDSSSSLSPQTPIRAGNPLFEALGVETPKLDQLLNNEKQIKHLVKSLLKKKKKKSKHLRHSEPMAWTVTEILKPEKQITTIEKVEKSDTSDKSMSSEKGSLAVVINRSETVFKETLVSSTDNLVQPDQNAMTSIEDVGKPEIKVQIAECVLKPSRNVVTSIKVIGSPIKSVEPVSNQVISAVDAKPEVTEKQSTNFSNSMGVEKSETPAFNISSQTLSPEKAKTVEPEPEPALKPTDIDLVGISSEEDVIVVAPTNAHKSDAVKSPENENKSKNQFENQEASGMIIEDDQLLEGDRSEVSNELSVFVEEQETTTKSVNDKLSSYLSGNVDENAGIRLAVATTKKNLFKEGLLNDSQNSITEDEDHGGKDSFGKDKVVSSSQGLLKHRLKKRMTKALKKRIDSSPESTTGRKLKKKERVTPNLSAKKKYPLRSSSGDEDGSYQPSKDTKSDENKKDEDDALPKEEFFEALSLSSKVEEEKAEMDATLDTEECETETNKFEVSHEIQNQEVEENLNVSCNDEIPNNTDQEGSLKLDTDLSKTDSDKIMKNTEDKPVEVSLIDSLLNHEEPTPVKSLTDLPQKSKQNVEGILTDTTLNVKDDGKKKLKKRKLSEESPEKTKGKKKKKIIEEEEEAAPCDLTGRLGVFDGLLFNGEEQFLPKDIKKAFLSQILGDPVSNKGGEDCVEGNTELDDTNVKLNKITNEKESDVSENAEKEGITDNMSELDDSVNSEEFSVKEVAQDQSLKSEAVSKVEDDDTKMFSDSADSQEEDDHAPLKKNLQDGIHKVVDWLDNESKTTEDTGPPQIPRLPTVSSHYHLADIGGKLSMTDEIISYLSPSSPIKENLKDSSIKPAIREEPKEMQTSVSIPKTDSDVEVKIVEQNNQQSSEKKNDKTIEKQQKTLATPTKVEEAKPAVNVSRRFKYGNLSAFNRKKVAPKAAPKLPAKVPDTKAKVFLSSGTESSTDDSISTVPERIEKKEATNDLLSSTEIDDNCSKLANTTTDSDLPCSTEIDNNSSKLANATTDSVFPSSTEIEVNSSKLANTTTDSNNLIKSLPVSVESASSASKVLNVQKTVISPSKKSKHMARTSLSVLPTSSINTALISTPSSVVSNPITVATNLFQLSSTIPKPSTPVPSINTLSNADAVNLLFQLSNPSIPSVPGISEDKNKDAFIDFKIEPSDFIPKRKEILNESLSEEPVITYDSQEDTPNQSSSEQWKQETPTSRPRIPSVSIADVEEEGCESPIYKPPKESTLPPPPDSPLKEMFFLIPKDTFDVQESHGESDAGSPPKLPELTSMMNHPHQQHLPNKKLNDAKYSNLSQMEEAQLIENELQDLLSTSRPTKPTQIVPHNKDLHDIVFDYNMVCYFDDCHKTFFDPVSQIDHAKVCMKGGKGRSAKWKILSKSTTSCPECKLSVQVDQFGVHFQDKHPVLFGMLKDLTLRKKVKCKNHRCKSIPTTVPDVVHHFRKCGVAAQGKTQISCDQCGCIFKSRRDSVKHKCNDDLDESDSDELSESVANIISTTRNSSQATNAKPLATLKENSSASSIKQEVSDLLKIIQRPTLEIPSFELQTNTGIGDALKHNEGAENLLKLQGICENILTQSNIPLMKTDSIPDETSEILASLEDLNKTVNQNNNSGLALLSTKLSKTKKNKEKSALSSYDFVDESTSQGNTILKDSKNKKKKSLRKSAEGADSTSNSNKMKKVDIEEPGCTENDKAKSEIGVTPKEYEAKEDKEQLNEKKRKKKISEEENTVDKNENIIESAIVDDTGTKSPPVSSKKKKRRVIEDDSTDDNAGTPDHLKSQRKPIKTYNLKSSVKHTPISTVVEDVKKKLSHTSTSEDSKEEETNIENTKEGANDDEDWSSPSVWLESVKAYNFYCPSDFCFKPFYKPNTMISHIRCCVRTAAQFYNKKINCPECDQSVIVKDLGKHLQQKHILIFWYLTELEGGHWVICQNHNCAKYMEDIAECVEHYRRCDYLWKCKYCDIEYKEEKDVEKHHCRTSSEDEGEGDGGGGNNNDGKKKNDNKGNKRANNGNGKENKENKNEKSRGNNNNKKKKEKKSNQTDRNLSLSSNSSKRTNRKSVIKKEVTVSNESNCEVAVESSNEVEKIVKIRDFTIECDIPIIKDKCKSLTVEYDFQVKNENEQITPKNEVNVKPETNEKESESTADVKKSLTQDVKGDFKLDAKGSEIEKVIKNIKKSICKKSGGLTEQALLEWQKKFIEFYFFCPLEKCGFKTCSPALLCTHLKSCKICIEELDMAVFSTQIESSTFYCPFDFCKKKSDNVPFFDFVRHVMSTHKMLMNYLKAVYNNGFAVCLNFRCAEELHSVDTAVEHFARCRYLWQCKDCYIEYRCDISVKSHCCDLSRANARVSEEDEMVLDNGKKRKRKSAARSSKQAIRAA